MNGKGAPIDAISNFSFIALIVVAVLLSLVGGHLIIFSQYLTTFVSFGIFIIPLVIVSVIRVKKYKEFKENEQLDELIIYLTNRDLNRDFFVNFLVGFIIITISLINNNVLFEDVIQAIIASIMYYLWHRLIYKKKQAGVEAVSLNNFDYLMDEIVVFIFPIFILILAAIISRIDLIDFIQALATFIIIYVWHKIIFK